jgi:hypothetical protein
MKEISITCVVCGYSYTNLDGDAPGECPKCHNVADPRTDTQKQAVAEAEQAELSELASIYGDVRAPVVMGLRQRWRSTVARLNAKRA